MPLYPPRDPAPCGRHPGSRPLTVGIADGNYVYVQDEAGVIHVLPDGPHRHPKVLGNGRPARYAGDLRIEAGRIQDVTNLSGTFQCDDPAGLREVAREIRRLGFTVLPSAVRFFPVDGSQPPSILE